MAYIRNISGTYMNYIGNIYETGYMGALLTEWKKRGQLPWFSLDYTHNWPRRNTKFHFVFLTNAHSKSNNKFNDFSASNTSKSYVLLPPSFFFFVLSSCYLRFSFLGITFFLQFLSLCFVPLCVLTWCSYVCYFFSHTPFGLVTELL